MTDDSQGDLSPSRVPKWRSVLSGLVGTLAVLAFTGGVIGIWSLRTAADSERFEADVEAVLETEEVSNAIATLLVAEIAEATDLRARIDEVTPDVLEPATDLLLAGVRSWVDDRVAELVRTDEVRSAIGAAAGTAHGEVVDLLTGDGLVDGIGIQEGEVRINLLPVTTRALVTLQGIGLFGDVDVPTFDRGGDPDEQRAELEDALGRDLPEHFGEPVVYSSDSLDQAGEMVKTAQRLLVFAKRSMWILIIGGLALAAGSIWLAAHRLRAGVFLAAGYGVLMLITRLGVDATVRAAPGAVKKSGAKVAVEDFMSSLQTSLNRTLMLFFVLTLALVAAGVVLMWRAARTAPASADADS